MSSKVYSASTYGMEGKIIEIEVDMSPGQPQFNIVGLPDIAVKESKDRVSSAIKNSGFRPPHFYGKVTVNLAPADIKKEGPSFDLPIALGVLVASHQIKPLPPDAIFLGECALDGRLRGIKGCLPIGLTIRENAFKHFYTPKESSFEANLVNDIHVYPVETLANLVNHLENKERIAPLEKSEEHIKKLGIVDATHDFSFIKGQGHAKRAIEIAVAGGHNILLSGPPGSGKTMLAKSISTIMPPMSINEAFEVTKIYSVSGLTNSENPFVHHRPFRSPHHSSSAVSMVGGGSHPKPGEISLANRGVLFLDEFSEFPREVIENLRQPLEDGTVSIARAQGTATYPARFILVAAMNPCPCGNASDPEKVCICTPSQINRYRRKLSGPIMDRIDLHIEVPRLKFEKLSSNHLAEESSNIRRRVVAARKKQLQRLSRLGIRTNSEMVTKHIRQFCEIGPPEKELLRNAIQQMQLSPRGYHRLLKVARTIADLAESKKITTKHLAEAIQYRFREDH